MLTLARPKAVRRPKAAGQTSSWQTGRATARAADKSQPDDISLVNSIGAAASRDLAQRAARVEDDEMALVNAVARAAARSLVS
ncbi:MAG: hypothetical protein RL077_2197 [Verrucomicrobiota bacterium]|jgi:hypothetical protein